MKNKLIIVAGCSGSGKTTIANSILKNFKVGVAQIISLDSFYLANSTKIPKLHNSTTINFDHPRAFDWELLIQCLKKLLNGQKTNIPQYNYELSMREKKWKNVNPTKVIILEGILPLINQKLFELATLKIFVDTPLDECFIRRLTRDQIERGRSIKSIIKQWQESVRPMYNQYVEPTKMNADLILPWHKINIVGLDNLTKIVRVISKGK